MTSPHYKNYINEVNAAKKREKKSRATILKELFMAQLKFAGFEDAFTPNEKNPKELRFHPDRQWRFDFACEREKVAVEIQGGTFGNPVKCHKCKSTVMRQAKNGGWFMVREGGRHQNAARLTGEYEKLNEAQRLGWRVFLFDEKMVRNKTAIDLISRIILPGPLESKGQAS